MYYINLQLTEKGSKVCGSPTKTLEMPWDKHIEPSDDDVNEFIESEFMSELVECVISVKPDFRFLKLNDYVCIVTPGKTESRTLGRVTHIQDDGYGHEIRVQVESANEGYTKEYRFTFEGLEIGGSRKNKTFIEVASPEIIEHFKKIQNICQTYEKVVDLLNHTYEWEDNDCYGYRRNTPPVFLEPEELLQIFDILENAKTRYDNLNIYEN